MMKRTFSFSLSFLVAGPKVRNFFSKYEYTMIAYSTVLYDVMLQPFILYDPELRNTRENMKGVMSNRQKGGVSSTSGEERTCMTHFHKIKQCSKKHVAPPLPRCGRRARDGDGKE